MLRDQTAYLERATEGLIEQLLPVLDAFELAMLNAGTDAERLRKGVELVYSELLGVLEKSGLERIEAQGKPFDPAEHEAVMHVEGAEPGVGGFGGPGGFGGGGPEGGFRFETGDLGDLGGLFGNLFGGRSRRGQGTRAGGGPRRGGDLEAQVHLSFDDAVRGATIGVQLTG